MSDISRARDAIENLYKHATILEEHFQVDSLYKVIQKVNKLENDLRTLDDTVKEFVSLTGTSNKGDAKQRIQALMNRQSNVRGLITERYNLDDSFLQKIGRRWDKSGDAETHEEIIRAIEKKIARQRDMVKEAYFYCLELVESQAKEQGYTEEQIKDEIADYHDAMREDFHNLTSTEFWMAYRGEFLGAELENQKKEEQRIPLIYAINLVEKVTPPTLRDSLKESGNLLGEIPHALFQRWEARAENLKNEVSREGKGAYIKLMVEIVGVAIHRLAVEEPGIPNQIQRGTLEQILLPPQYNPYGSDNCVGGDARLRDVVGYYIEHITTKPSRF